MLLKFDNFVLDKDCKITYSFNGMQTIEFELFDDEYVECERAFIADNNKYIVKSIENNNVSCELDFRSLREIFFEGKKKFESATLTEILTKLAKNWTILNSQTKIIRRTLEIEDSSAIAAIIDVAKLYDCSFEFDCLNKIIKVVDEARFIDLVVSKDINLVSIDIKSDTYEHYTRLYAYGKDDITFAEINEGKNYVEDLTYTDKVIPAVFRDDRFTVKDNLKEHCLELLAKHSKPLKEYTIKVIDLSDDNTYHNIKLHDEFVLLNPKTKQKEKHRVIQLVKYTVNSSLNEITVVNKTKGFTEYVSTFEDRISADVVKKVNDDFKTRYDDQVAKLNERFEKLNLNGYRIETGNATYFVDKLPKEQAVNVLKIGVGGIMASSNGWNGPFELAISNDGRLNANMMTTGKLDGQYIKGASITADKLTVETKEELRDGLVTKEILSSFKADQNGIIQEINQKIDRSTDKTKQLLPAIINQEISRRKSELKGADGTKGDKGERGQDGRDGVPGQPGRSITYAYANSSDGKLDFTNIPTNVNADIIVKNRPRFDCKSEESADIMDIWQTRLNIKLQPNTKYTLTARARCKNYVPNSNKANLTVNLRKNTDTLWEIEFNNREYEIKHLTFITPQNWIANEEVAIRGMCFDEDYEWTGCALDWYVLAKGDKVYTDYPDNIPAQYQKYRYLGITNSYNINDYQEYDWTDISQKAKENNYVYIRYSDFADGSNFNSVSGKYVGICKTSLSVPPTDKRQYTWQQIKGQDGRTIYTHIAYADNQSGAGLSFSPTNKKYIGIYQDYTQANSTNASNYTWSKWVGDNGQDGRDGASISSNYIRYYDNPMKWPIYSIINGAWEKSYENDILVMTCKVANNNGFYIVLADFLSNREFQNKVMSWSLDIKSTRNNTFNAIGCESNGLTAKNVTTEWQRISHTFTNIFTKFKALVFYNAVNQWQVNDKVYIKLPKIEFGDTATPPCPAPEDMIPHSLTASVRSDRVYKNNVLSSGKSYVDVFYDGQKVSTGFTLNYLYKTGDVGWIRINGKSYSADGSFDSAPTQQQNGQPFYIRCEISYKDLNTVADLRLDNILDGKDLIGNNLMYDSRFESIADSLKSNANPKTQFNIIDNVLRATASNNLDIRVRLKTSDNSTDKRNEYDNTYLRFNFRAKANTNVKLTGRLGFGGFVANQEQSVTTDWRQYTMLITDGGTGYDNWMALFTDKPCTLEIADCTVYNEGAMVVIKDVEQRQKVFESKLDSFTSVIGVTKQKISMSNADNLCTESNVTKTGNDLYFNLKSNKVANQKYTVIFEAENVPQNQKTAVYHSVQDKNIDNRPILKEGSNLYVVDFTGDLDNRINLYPCGANTKISNFRVYKGDFINDSFAKTEELTALQTKIAQTDREIGFAAERTERIEREVKPGENLCTEAGSKNINDQYWLIKENVVANQIYTLVCDIANPPKEQKASIYNSKTVDNKQLLVNGQNVFTFSYDPNKIPQNPKINLYPVGDKTVVSNVRIYKGDYNWYFKKDKIVTEQQLKSELKITADNITSTVEGKIDSKVSKTEFDQTKDHIELSYVKNDKVINAINLSKEGTKITGGAIVDNLYGKTIVGATLQGDTKIKIGQYGFMQPIDCGLQINAPATYGANYGVGLQIAGRSEGNVPKGLFIYNDPNFAYGNTIGNSINDILLTVKGKVSLCNNFDGEVVQGCPVISNFNYSNPVRGCYRISFLGWDANSNSLYFDDGTGSNGTWWVKPDSSSSDIKLKNNIIDCTHNALDFIKKLNFKEFDWIPDKFNYTKAHTKIGLIAQDVQKIDETLVNNLGGTLHLDDFRLLNINLKATQELNEENIKLRKELESTTRELINQRKEIIQLKQEIQNIKNLIKGDK